jgi:redox-sensing transcriptional repressor
MPPSDRNEPLAESATSRDDDLNRSDAASVQTKTSASGVSLSGASVGRLSLYYRELHRLMDLQADSVNSRELGKMVDVSPAVVRRDLSVLGPIGRRGVGYDVGTLIESIGAVLGSGMKWKVVLVGVGSLGHALLRYRGFERLGFRLVAAYDSDPNKIGKSIADVPIHSSESMESSLGKRRPELAILAVPADQALEIAATLVRCGVHGILNFAPTTLKLPTNIAVVNVDLASELQRLAFAVHTRR